jgi:hypothetical protein
MNKINIACIIDDDPFFILEQKKNAKTQFCNNFIEFHNGKDALIN